MATYVPNANNTSEPTGGRPVKSAAPEFRKLKEKVERALIVPESGPYPELPTAAERALKLLGFDSLGQPMMYVGADSGSALALQLLLANGTIPSGGGGALGYTGVVSYLQGTLGFKVQRTGITPEDFGAVGDGVTDDTAAVQAAINYVATLTGPQYQDSFGSGGGYGYGVSRALHLTGRKYAISNTLLLSGDVSLICDRGGFLALAGFAAGAPMIDTGANPYGGTIENICLDAYDRNVVPLRIPNGHACKILTPSVNNMRGHGIEVLSGAECLIAFPDISHSPTPAAFTSAGIFMTASDSVVIGGVCKYGPLGVYLNGGGNNVFINVHCWGLYSANRQYVNFYSVNSVRNKFIGCYPDSPAKQNYALPNTNIINGIPNGGYGYYFDANSAQPKVVESSGNINTTAWNAYVAANPGAAGNHPYLIYCAAQFYNFAFCDYNYAGPWAGDLQFSSLSIRDMGVSIGMPSLANGLRAAVLGQYADNGGGTTAFIIQNSVAVPLASSTASITRSVGANSWNDEWTYGTAGASYARGSAASGEKYRYAASLTTFTQNNSAEGDMSVRIASGVGSYSPFTAHRTDGGAVPNAAFAACKMGTISSNNRSLNVAGTVNVSGADYAEYLRKCALCGLILKGALVGITGEKELTDRWDDAVHVMIKSTNPSFVGGDIDTSELGELKQAPEWDESLPENATEEDIAAYEKKAQEFDLAEKQWRKEYTAWYERYEVLRQEYDRVAFSGIVPVNVWNATPGQFIVPFRTPDGKIDGTFVSDPDLKQYIAAVGKVIGLESDGRAIVVVKPV